MTPGGLLLLETLQREGLMRHYASQAISYYPDGLIVLEERTFDLLTSRNDIVVTMLTSDGQRTEYSQSLRIYTLTELAHMLAMAGLRVKAYYGGWDHNSFTMGNFSVILIGQKAEKIST